MMESVDAFEVFDKQISAYYLRRAWVGNAVWKPNKRLLTAIVDVREVLSPVWRFPQYAASPRSGYESTEAK
jgi:hypothetical protein